MKKEKPDLIDTVLILLLARRTNVKNNAYALYENIYPSASNKTYSLLQYNFKICSFSTNINGKVELTEIIAKANNMSFTITCSKS